MNASGIHVVNVCPWCRHESGYRGSSPWAVNPSKHMIILSFVWCYNRSGTCTFQPSGVSDDEYIDLIRTRTYEIISSTQLYRRMLQGTYMGIPVIIMYRVKNASTGGFYRFDISEAYLDNMPPPYTP